jgi:hypothetical protein
VHEVKAEAIGGDKRASLFDVAPEYLPEGGVQQVRRRVVAARRIARLDVNFGRDKVAGSELTP